MAMHALKLAGLTEIRSCIVVPMATGMSLVLSMLAVRARCANRAAQYAIWIRIDQATCFKSMRTAGLTPIIVENTIEVCVFIHRAALVSSYVSVCDTVRWCVAERSVGNGPRGAEANHKRKGA